MDSSNTSTLKRDLLEFSKYTLASALALAIDYLCYWTLVSNNAMDAPKAAVLGYSAGLVVAYFLIADKVFKNGWLHERRKVEALLFIFSGFIGIATTYITVKTIIFIFGERVIMAKIVAVAISFIVVYIARKIFVFKKKDCCL